MVCCSTNIYLFEGYSVITFTQYIKDGKCCQSYEITITLGNDEKGQDKKPSTSAFPSGLMRMSYRYVCNVHFQLQLL